MFILTYSHIFFITSIIVLTIILVSLQGQPNAEYYSKVVIGIFILLMFILFILILKAIKDVVM